MRIVRVRQSIIGTGIRKGKIQYRKGFVLPTCFVQEPRQIQPEIGGFPVVQSEIFPADQRKESRQPLHEPDAFLHGGRGVEVADAVHQRVYSLFGKLIGQGEKGVSQIFCLCFPVRCHGKHDFAGMGKIGQTSGEGENFFRVPGVPVQHHETAQGIGSDPVIGGFFGEPFEQENRLIPVFVGAVAVKIRAEMSVLSVAEPFTVPPPAGCRQNFRQTVGDFFVSGEFRQTFAEQGNAFLQIYVAPEIVVFHGVDAGKKAVHPPLPVVCVTEQFVNGHAEIVGDGGDQVHVGKGGVLLPAADSLTGHAQSIREILLCAAVPFPELAYFGTQLYGHLCSS